MWTPAARAQLARGAVPCATCLTDAERALVEPRMPAPAKAGRPRPWPTRLALDGVLHVPRTGRAWARLPRGFPPPGTVHRRFLRLARAGAVGVAGVRGFGAARQAVGRSGTRPWARTGACWPRPSRPRPCTTATAGSPCRERRDGPGRSCSGATPTALAPGRGWRGRPPSRSRSSAARRTSAASPSSPGAGRSSAPPPGPGVAAASPGTTRPRQARRWPSSFVLAGAMVLVRQPARAP
jgi:transposase